MSQPGACLVVGMIEGFDWEEMGCGGLVSLLGLESRVRGQRGFGFAARAGSQGTRLEAAGVGGLRKEGVG